MNHDRIAIFAASAAICAWLSLLSFPMIGDSARVYAICQAIGLCLYMGTVGLAYAGNLATIAARIDQPQLIILLIVFTSPVLQLHGDESDVMSGIFYTSLLPFMALTLSVLWTMPMADFERCMSVTSIVLCVFGISAIAIYGWPEGRTIGGLLHPNLYSAPLLAAFVFSQFRPGLTGQAVRIICFGLIATVSSRYALMGCLIALVVHEMTFDPFGKAKIPIAVLALAAAIIFWPQISSIVALDDPDRGAGSGFTGRDDRWQNAMDAITENPFGIGFKRAIGDDGGHSGYLKLIVEFGVPGGFALVSLLAWCIAVAGIKACSASGKSRQQHRFDCARFAGMCAMYFGALFQPQIFSLGDSFTVAFMLLLFRPRDEAMLGRAQIAAKSGVSPRRR